VPAPLPPKLTFTGDLVLSLSRADAALGELPGVDGQLLDVKLLDAPFKRQEALCSSRIEGAEVSLSDLLLDQVAAARADVPRHHLREVRSCIATLRFGVERLQDVPLSLDLVSELHEWLLRGEIGGARSPGEFRTSQNWLGRPGSTLPTATYVPPPVPEMLEALSSWDDFLRDRDSFPDLIQCAMLHEQFEAIHPFVGGNGRLGRLLITLFLIDRKRLARPLLYLSAYLEGHRDEYYVLLQRVRTHGEWTPWLQFFLDGVRQTADRATAQARALIRHYDACHSLLSGDSLALADESFRTPCLTAPFARRSLGLSKSAARSAVAELVAKGLLEEWQDKHRPRVYLARPVLNAVLHPLEELRRPLREVTAGAVVLKSGQDESPEPPKRADRLMAEAMAIIDAARQRDVRLRLTGGLAVRRYCLDLAFMDREYSDIDFVADSSESRELHEVFADLGYVENRYVTQATDASQLQYIKAEALREMRERSEKAADKKATDKKAAGKKATDKKAAGKKPADKKPADEKRYDAPLVDHIDIFLDVMRMDHDVDVHDRLDLDDYAISPVDALIAKLQIGKINQKDVHDVVALVKDIPLHEAGAEGEHEISIDVEHLVDVCSGDWGLYHDITTNLDVVLATVGDYGLPEDALQKVRERFMTIREALQGASKPIAWQLRAAVGERVAWRREVEDTEGTPVVAPEWDWRRDLG
jgi:Fic family protein